MSLRIRCFFGGQSLNYRGFLEKGEAENLQNCGQTAIDFEFAFEDRHQHVGTDRDPDTGLHCVLAGAEERFDAQVLFDPLEEQFDLPAGLVQPGDRERRDREVVGQEDEPSVGFGIVVRHASQGIGMQTRRLHSGQQDRLIAARAACCFAKSGRLVDLSTDAARVIEIAFGSRHEEGRMSSEPQQPCEIDAAAVHHRERPRLDRQMVEYRDIVNFPVGNRHKTGNVAAQVQQRVPLDGSFASPKPYSSSKTGLREERQAEVDRGRVERRHRLFEHHRQRLVRVQLPSLSNQHLSEVGIDPPVVNLIRIGERTARNASSKTRVVELRLHRSQTRFDVAQALAKRELRERQTQKLIATREAPQPIVAACMSQYVSTHTRVEFVPRKKLHELRKHHLPGKHLSTSTARPVPKTIDSDKSS